MIKIGGYQNIFFSPIIERFTVLIHHFAYYSTRSNGINEHASVSFICSFYLQGYFYYILFQWLLSSKMASLCVAGVLQGNEFLLSRSFPENKRKFESSIKISCSFIRCDFFPFNSKRFFFLPQIKQTYINT